MLQRFMALILVGGLVLGAGAWAGAAQKAAPKATDEPDDGIQGVYQGADALKAVSVMDEAKVIGQGGGEFKVILTADKGRAVELTGKLEGGKVALTGAGGESGTIADKKLSVTVGDKKYELAYKVIKPPSLGQKPPAGAVVLLPFEEGKKTNLDAWVALKGGPATWVPQEDGSVLITGGGDIQTKQEFTNVVLHVEFRCPYMPAARGQGRGNSGVYLQSRYEVQVLDSFGLAPKDNECGGLYSVATPKVIASLPPARWQTYDITFHAPTVENGKIVKPATMSVAHNGIQIHRDVKIDHVTTAGVGGPIKSPAPLMLQDHGNPVRFRNIWLVELKD
jgi:hypothetical protein